MVSKRSPPDIADLNVARQTISKWLCDIFNSAKICYIFCLFYIDIDHGFAKFDPVLISHVEELCNYKSVSFDITPSRGNVVSGLSTRVNTYWPA